MKNIVKIASLLCAAALALVSCQNKELDTAQYDDTAVTLASFGPNPAVRGGSVSFYGSNLDKITEVIIPGMGSITGSAIEVVASGKISQIRVALDKESPEVGYITLKSSDGKEFVTKSELSYKESIVFDGFEANDANYPGDVITLKGTYMDLVKAVIFEGGEEVEVEEGSTRHEAKVVIPATALTGLIMLSDKAEIESVFYSENELVMGEPTVNAAQKATVKVGETITVKGVHLEMIEKIVFDGAEVTEFTLSEDCKTITLTLPATAKSGEYKLVSFAGKEYKAGEIDAVVPTVASVAPSPVKAGQQLTIKGDNLDLVNKVSFDGEENATFSYADGALTIAVTDKVKEGKVSLITANESAVEAEFTLVHPVITSVSPLEIYAGDDLTVKGTDLDLITSAQLGGKDVEIVKATETEITLKTLASSVAGEITLGLNNGETVKSADKVAVKYHALVIVTERPASQHIGQTVTLKGENMNLVESIYIGDVKVTKYSMRNDNELSFLMPWNKVGMYDIKFVLYNGDEEIQSEQIEVLLEQVFTDVFEGEATVSWNNAVTIPNSLLKAGMSIVADYKVVPMSEGYSMLRVINSDWSFNPEGVDAYNHGFGEDGAWEIPVTKELMDNLAGKDMAFSGYGCAVTKVVLIGEIPQEKTIWEGSQKVAWQDDAPFLDAPGSKALTALAYGAFDWSTVEAGTTLTVYYNMIPEAGYSQLRFGNGNWASIPAGSKYPGADGDGNINLDSDKISIVLNQEDIDALVAGNGLVLCGHGYEITKVTTLL